VVDAGDRLLLEAVQEAIEPHRILIVGVSGGVDSVVLLDALAQQRNQERKIIVAHVNHHLRDTSTRDAHFVASLAESYGFSCETLDATPPLNGNTENWGRQTRYAFFKELQDRFAADAVMTAHSKSDQHELFLMRMFSHKPFHAMAPFEARRSLLRPLLSCTRAQILRYATNRKITWMEDETNQDNSFLRNRTRNIVIPMLREQYGASVDEAIDDQITQTQEAEAVLYELLVTLEATLTPLRKYSKPWKHQVVSLLQDAPTAVRWRLMDKLYFDEFSLRLGRRAGLRLADFFLSNAPQLQLPHGKTIRRIDGEVRFEDS
jgi:tRNA(Ile)-lysidine synthetase-like protein